MSECGVGGADGMSIVNYVHMVVSGYVVGYVVPDDTVGGSTTGGNGG